MTETDPQTRSILLKSIAFTALGIIALLIMAGIAFVLSSDDRLKSLLESKGGDRTGRTLTIGDLDIQWGWQMAHVRLADIHLANAPDLPEPDMISIKAVDFD